MSRDHDNLLRGQGLFRQAIAGFAVRWRAYGLTIVGAPGQATQITGPVSIAGSGVTLQGLVFNASVSTTAAANASRRRKFMGRFRHGRKALWRRRGIFRRWGGGLEYPAAAPLAPGRHVRYVKDTQPLPGPARPHGRPPGTPRRQHRPPRPTDHLIRRDGQKDSPDPNA